MHIHMPTMFLAIIFSCLSLILSVGWVTGRNNDDGLFSWVIALCLLASAFCLWAFRGYVPDSILLIAGSVTISLFYSIFLFSLVRFQGRRPSRFMLWVPPTLMGILSAVFVGNFQYRVCAVNAVCFIQASWIFWYLIAYRYDFPSRGRNLIVAAMFITMVVLVMRVVTALVEPSEISNFRNSSPVQALTFLTQFVVIILISNGFIMMSKERSDQRLKTVAMKDKLTDCWNRIRIEEAGRQEMARLMRYGHPVSLIMVDLDHFKTINDRYGHFAGDAVLKGFAEIARSSLRSTDILGRWGGEEFVIILPSSGFPEAVAIAERVRNCLELHEFPEGCRITASMGVATCLSTDSWDDWLERADRGLYRAKTGGRNRAEAEGLDVDASYGLEMVGNSPQLLWQPSFNSGDVVLDEQHRALVRRTNGLLCLGAGEANKSEIAEAARGLMEDISSHFQDEQAILQRHGYEGVGDHAGHHKHLLVRLAFMIDLFRDDRIGTMELVHFIVYEVIAQHILIDDRKFFPLFAENVTECEGAA